MLQAPTGFGKTLTAAHIIRRALDKGKRVAFIVPRKSLVDQAVGDFAHEGLHAVGVVQAYHPMTDGTMPVQVCSAQTLARRKRPDADLVLVDEAHEMHRAVLKWMGDCPEVPFIGLSATPWSRGLGRYYDDLVIAAATRELIGAGFLSDFVAYAPSEPDLSSVSTGADGDFKEDELADVMDAPTITGDIVLEWQKRGEDLPTFVFCLDGSYLIGGRRIEVLDQTARRNVVSLADLHECPARRTALPSNASVLDSADLEATCGHSARRREQGSGQDARDRPMASPRRSLCPQARCRPRRSMPDRVRWSHAGGAPWLTTSKPPSPPAPSLRSAGEPHVRQSSRGSERSSPTSHPACSSALGRRRSLIAWRTRGQRWPRKWRTRHEESQGAQVGCDGSIARRTSREGADNAEEAQVGAEGR
jgi:hypothetical protein